MPLGNSQVTVLPVAQLASVLGVYGLSALVALVNAAIAVRAADDGRPRADPRDRRRRRRARRRRRLGAPGASPTAALTREGTPLRVGLVQGNIAQEDKWKPREARRIFTTHIGDDARRRAPRRASS